MESRSMLGVSIIRVYFQPGTSADADVTELSNLALADLKRLPPGTLPPVVLKFDASSLPVALVTVKGEGLDETQLHDYAQFQIRIRLRACRARKFLEYLAERIARSWSMSTLINFRRGS